MAIIKDQASTDDVAMRMNLRDDIGMDELDIVETFLRLEEAFDVEIGDESEDLKTVEAIVRHIEGKVS